MSSIGGLRLRRIRGLLAGVQRFAPGLLKNAIDWVSRYQPQPFNERHGLLLSASPSMVGGTAACGRCASRSSISARVSIRTCSHSLRPTRLFDEEGRIADPQLQARFDTNIVNFMDLVEASKHYPCVKRSGSSTSASVPSLRSTASSDGARARSTAA